MYIAGRSRTGSRPSRTSMFFAVYSSPPAGRGGRMLAMSAHLQRGRDDGRRDDPREAVALDDRRALVRARSEDVGELHVARLALLGLDGHAIARPERGRR